MTSRGPVPSVVLFDEIQEGVGDGRVVRDEPTVKVGEAKE